MRKIFVLFVICCCFGGVMAIFWYQEVQYSLPTKVPVNYKPVSLQTKVSFQGVLNAKALFLHFYNPDCPCSRFNANHVQQLIHDHGDSINFFIIVPHTADIKKAKDKFGDHLSYLADDEGKITSACGVYSTSQAVIVGKEGRLFFRGNYNRSRYCTSQASNYAELALLSFINGRQLPLFGALTTTPYGCELPDQTNSLAEIF